VSSKLFYGRREQVCKRWVEFTADQWRKTLEPELDRCFIYFGTYDEEGGGEMGRREEPPESLVKGALNLKG